MSTLHTIDKNVRKEKIILWELKEIDKAITLIAKTETNDEIPIVTLLVDDIGKVILELKLVDEMEAAKIDLEIILNHKRYSYPKVIREHEND